MEWTSFSAPSIPRPQDVLEIQHINAEKAKIAVVRLKHRYSNWFDMHFKVWSSDRQFMTGTLHYNNLESAEDENFPLPFFTLFIEEGKQYFIHVQVRSHYKSKPSYTYPPVNEFIYVPESQSQVNVCGRKVNYAIDTDEGFHFDPPSDSTLFGNLCSNDEENLIETYRMFIPPSTILSCPEPNSFDILRDILDGIEVKTEAIRFFSTLRFKEELEIAVEKQKLKSRKSKWRFW